jgi:hypothetical protein
MRVPLRRVIFAPGQRLTAAAKVFWGYRSFTPASRADAQQAKTPVFVPFSAVAR